MVCLPQDMQETSLTAVTHGQELESRHTLVEASLSSMHLFHLESRSQVHAERCLGQRYQVQVDVFSGDPLFHQLCLRCVRRCFYYLLYYEEPERPHALSLSMQFFQFCGLSNRMPRQRTILLACDSSSCALPSALVIQLATRTQTQVISYLVN